MDSLNALRDVRNAVDADPETLTIARARLERRMASAVPARERRRPSWRRVVGFGTAALGAAGVATTVAVLAFAGATVPLPDPVTPAGDDVEIRVVDMAPAAGTFLKAEEHLEQLLVVQSPPDDPEEPFVGAATRADARSAILTRWPTTSCIPAEPGAERVVVTTAGFEGVEIYGDRAAASTAWDAKYASQDAYGRGVFDPAPLSTNRYPNPSEPDAPSLYELTRDEFPSHPERLAEHWAQQASARGDASVASVALSALQWPAKFSLEPPSVRTTVFDALQLVDGIQVMQASDGSVRIEGSLGSGSEVVVHVDASRGIVTMSEEFLGERGSGGIVPDGVPDVRVRFSYETVLSAP